MGCLSLSSFLAIERVVFRSLVIIVKLPISHFNSIHIFLHIFWRWFIGCRYIYKYYSILVIYRFIIMKCSCLVLVSSNAPCLKVYFDVYIAIPRFPFLMFVWFIFFYSFIFKLSRAFYFILFYFILFYFWALYFMNASYKQHVVGFFFKTVYLSIQLLLLNNITYIYINVITDILMALM